MAWLLLLAAGALEIVWAASLKQSEGFTRLQPSLVTVVAMAGSFVLLAMAMRTLPLGVAYTVWTGIGAIGAFAVGAAGDAVGNRAIGQQSGDQDALAGEKGHFREYVCVSRPASYRRRGQRLREAVFCALATVGLAVGRDATARLSRWPANSSRLRSWFISTISSVLAP